MFYKVRTVCVQVNPTLWGQNVPTYIRNPCPMGKTANKSFSGVFFEKVKMQKVLWDYTVGG